MPNREDETIINVQYNGHSPNCTCRECTESRLRKPISETFDEEEKDWISTLEECPYCHKNLQMWNKKDKKHGCMNVHCQKYYEYL